MNKRSKNKRHLDFHFKNNKTQEHKSVVDMPSFQQSVSAGVLSNLISSAIVGIVIYIYAINNK